MSLRGLAFKNKFSKRRHVTAWIDLLESEGVVTRSIEQDLLPRLFYVLTETLTAMATPQNLHIGQMIKAVFDESGMTVAEFARQIHLERTTVYSIFERPTVDVLQLARISLALKHNFLSDVEQYFGLAPQRSSLTLHLDHLSPEIAAQLANLLNTASI